MVLGLLPRKDRQRSQIYPVGTREKRFHVEKIEESSLCAKIEIQNGDTVHRLLRGGVRA